MTCIRSHVPHENFIPTTHPEIAVESDPGTRKLNRALLILETDVAKAAHGSASEQELTVLMDRAFAATIEADGLQSRNKQDVVARACKIFERVVSLTTSTSKDVSESSIGDSQSSVSHTSVVDSGQACKDWVRDLERSQLDKILGCSSISDIPSRPQLIAAESIKKRLVESPNPQSREPVQQPWREPQALQASCEEGLEGLRLGPPKSSEWLQRNVASHGIGKNSLYHLKLLEQKDATKVIHEMEYHMAKYAKDVAKGMEMAPDDSAGPREDHIMPVSLAPALERRCMEVLMESVFPVICGLYHVSVETLRVEDLFIIKSSMNSFKPEHRMLPVREDTYSVNVLLSLKGAFRGGGSYLKVSRGECLVHHGSLMLQHAHCNAHNDSYERHVLVAFIGSRWHTKRCL